MEGYLFDGDTYDPALDRERLSKQLGRVWSMLNQGGWWTLHELAQTSWRGYGASDSEAGISARLRDLRKDKFGGYNILRRRRDNAGTWEYSIDRKRARI